MIQSKFFNCHIKRFGTGLQKASIYSTSSLISTSLIKQQSLSDSINDQGGNKQIFLNTLTQAIAETGAKEIGFAAHSYQTDAAGNILTNSNGEALHQINKATQLTLHATLGAGISTLSSSISGSETNTATVLSGAVSGVIGEVAADAAYKEGRLDSKGQALGFSRETSIQLGGLAGSAGALFASAAMGADDKETANNLQLGQFIGGNAAANNATYILKTTKETIAYDEKDDGKFILIDEAEAQKLRNAYYRSEERFPLEDALPQSSLLLAKYDQENMANSSAGILKLEPSYQYQTDGKTYYLALESNFNELAAITGSDGISYSKNLTDKIFNNESGGDMLNIFFQNGMQNNYEMAKQSADLISKLTNREVGLIVNKTAGGNLETTSDYLKSIAGDGGEFFANKIYLGDALTGEVYQKIAADNSNSRNLVIMHSAGNKDAIKSAEYLQMKGINLDNKIDFISVGSPKSFNELKAALEPIGGNLTKQYNNWKDPVTHPKIWMGGGALTTAATTMVLYKAATSLGAINLTNNSGTLIEALANLSIKTATTAAPAVGAVGAVGAVAKSQLNIQHPFEAYFSNNFKGVQTDIKQWSVQNPASAY